MLLLNGSTLYNNTYIQHINHSYHWSHKRLLTCACFEMSCVTIIVIGAILLFYFLFTRKRRMHSNLPPGPRGWPVLGNFSQLDPLQPYVSMREMAKIYGPIFKIYLGKKMAIVLDSHEVIKEAFVHRAADFSERPENVLLNVILQGRNGVVYGSRWRAHRRLALSSLKRVDLECTTQGVEDVVRSEIKSVLQDIEKQHFEQVDLDGPFWHAIGNITSLIILGQSFECNDPEMLEFQQRIRTHMEHYTDFQLFLVSSFPWLRFLLFNSEVYQQFHINFGFIRDFAMRHIKRHECETKLSNGTKNYNFVDAYLSKMKEKNGKSEVFTKENLLYSVIDLFFAGQDTTIATLGWAVLYLITYPDIQEKIRKEIRENVALGKMPEWQDRLNMPYTQAVLLEIQRCSNIAPLGLLHATAKDVWFRNYFIPKGVMVIPNLWSVHMDEKRFPNPEQFYPERFLDNGELENKVEGLIPFSVGKRKCLGESLAKIELFLFLTCLVQNYRISKIPGIQYSWQRHGGITVPPLSYKVQLEKIE